MVAEIKLDDDTGVDPNCEGCRLCFRLDEGCGKPAWLGMTEEEIDEMEAKHTCTTYQNSYAYRRIRELLFQDLTGHCPGEEL